MVSKARLSEEQRPWVERTARDKGLTCPDCGSSEPVAQGEVRAPRPDGVRRIAMGCESCESVSEMTLVLSPEEAKALGLHALRNDPEAPDNP